MSYQFKVQVLLPYCLVKHRWAQVCYHHSEQGVFFQSSPPTRYVPFLISQLCVFFFECVVLFSCLAVLELSVAFSVSKFPPVTQNATVATFRKLWWTSHLYQLWLVWFVDGGRSEIALRKQWETTRCLLRTLFASTPLSALAIEADAALARKTNIYLYDCAPIQRRATFSPVELILSLPHRPARPCMENNVYRYWGEKAHLNELNWMNENRQ